MGAVYEGENVRIRRRVAIKVLHPAVSAQEESVRRFKREAQAAAQIGSDHICEVLDLGVLPDGTHYMVMEYLEGDTLGARLKHTGRFPPERIIPILSQALDALGAAHAAGIIHRDLKPDNIFIVLHKAGIHDFVKILDFGVSKFSQLSGEEMNMTRQGAVVGTPYYMSPEQARGGQVDQRSDIYALGVLLFQAITGQVPFQATTFNELLFKIVLEPAPPPRQFVPDLDPDFAAIIQRAMARDPAHRFQSCMEFKDALLAWLAARPTLTSGSPMLQAALAQRQPKTQALPAMPAPATGPLAMTPQPVPSPLSPHLTPSGNAWATASNPGGLPVPQTANSWADASGTSAPARPPSRAPVIAIAVATVLLVGAVSRRRVDQS
jgi:serine/threonine-protein kinase